MRSISRGELERLGFELIQNPDGTLTLRKWGFTGVNGIAPFAEPEITGEVGVDVQLFQIASTDAFSTLLLN